MGVGWYAADKGAQAVAVGVVALLAGLTFKMGAVPGHFWVPDVTEGAPRVVAGTPGRPPPPPIRSPAPSTTSAGSSRCSGAETAEAVAPARGAVVIAAGTAVATLVLGIGSGVVLTT